MKAVGIYVIIKKIKVSSTIVGGLELTESQNKDVRYLRGEVISCGNQVECIKEGDIVHYDKHSGHNVEIDSVLYQVLRLPDIVLVE